MPVTTSGHLSWRRRVVEETWWRKRSLGINQRASLGMDETFKESPIFKECLFQMTFIPASHSQLRPSNGQEVTSELLGCFSLCKQSFLEGKHTHTAELKAACHIRSCGACCAGLWNGAIGDSEGVGVGGLAGLQSPLKQRRVLLTSQWGRLRRPECWIFISFYDTQSIDGVASKIVPSSSPIKHWAVGL